MPSSRRRIAQQPSRQTSWNWFAKEAITALEESTKDPESVAFTALERHFSHYTRGDVRYVPTVAEHIADLKAVTRGRCCATPARCADCQRQRSRSGDFDAASVKSALNSAFGSSKLPTPFARVSREHRVVATKVEKIATPDKENATFVARVAFPLQDKAADYPALVLADFIVGGSAGARLFQRVRGKEWPEL